MPDRRRTSKSRGAAKRTSPEREFRRTRRFDPAQLDSRTITLPLRQRIAAQEQSEPGGLYKVIIDLNYKYSGGRDLAREKVRRLLGEINPKKGGINYAKSALSRQYLFGELSAKTILRLVVNDEMPESSQTPHEASPGPSTPHVNRAIHLIWPDPTLRARLTKTLSTVKADAAHYAFAAFGKDIVWAVVDSGIEGEHVHFNEHHNLDVPPPLKHRDFTALDDASSSKSAPAGVDPFTLSAIGWHSDNERPLEDPYGHGTHVAGIIAGENTAKLGPILAVVAEQDQESKRVYRRLSDREVPAISGLAPKCKLLSLKVLDAEGSGDASSIIAAIGYIQELNDFGRRLVVHGVNISATYPFFPEWFACGQSPVCVEVNRLVKTGVVVVVSAGNTGYANEAVYRFREEAAGPPIPAGQPLSINDPGNAEEAITVGSTHRESPHKFGISYFSSKGPTGDGRAKPDLVAPGEKVISCAAGDSREKRVAGVADNKGCDYCEDTGTSMAAPHVSGAIAAFLSIRPEFIGRAEEVKRIFLATATDLGRNRDFQGRGLIDLMRAIQSI